MEKGYYEYEFEETPTFERLIKKICDNEEEESLIKHEVAYNRYNGDPIIGSSGIRKIRVSLKDKGKRSSARVIYYFTDDNNAIVFFLLIYKKADQEDLTPKQEKLLLKIVEDFKKDH